MVFNSPSSKKRTTNRHSGLLELLQPVDTNPSVFTRQNLIFNKIKNPQPPENTDNNKKPQIPANPSKNKNETEAISSSHHNTTGIPVEVFYQLGNYLFQQATKSTQNHTEQKKPAKLHIIENYFKMESSQQTQDNDSARHNSIAS